MRSDVELIRVSLTINPLNEHVLSVPAFCGGIEKIFILTNRHVSELSTTDADGTYPLNDTILKLVVQGIHSESPGWFPVGMVARAKYVPFSFEEVISVSPKCFPYLQSNWSAIGIGHES